MKVSDRLALIDKIGRELQRRFSYSEIDAYLAAFSINPPSDVNVNSKWVYSKAALKAVTLSQLAEIAVDLDLGDIKQIAAQQLPPANWRGTSDFRLFISHVSKDKLKATRLRQTLAPFSISGFVAHEDIHPTLQWQSEIESALFCMDAFLAIHTVGFAASCWTQQEVGFAVARGVKIISLKMGEDPTGFISRHQALPRLDRKAEEIAKEVDKILSSDPLTQERLALAKKDSRVSQTLPDEIPF